MKALEIIAAKVSNEGFPVPVDIVRELLLRKVREGSCVVLKFGQVVFTVNKDPQRPMVHLYSADGGVGLLPAFARFHRAVWKRVKHKHLAAPISNPTIVKIVLRFGWKEGLTLTTGHKMYYLERPR